MAKPTQLWPGQRMKTFFRSIFQNEAGVDDELADRLAQICERHINRMLVWNGEPAPIKKHAPNPKQEIIKETTEDISTTEAGAPWSVEHLEDANEERDNEAATENSIAETSPPFDPFAFSAVVLLARSGADTLMAQLNEIDSADNLRELANAQHLGVEAGIRKPDALRKAIVRGAKQRLADRRAAAS